MLPCNYNCLSSPCLKSHALARSLARAHAPANKHGRTLANHREHKQAGVHAHEQAWLTFELFEERWGGGVKPISPTHLSPPELFYSYQRIGAHQLFTSVKGGTRRSTEIQPERKGTESNSDGRTDGRTDNRRVYGPMPLCPSINLPGRPVCPLDAAGAPNNASDISTRCLSHLISPSIPAAD